MSYHITTVTSKVPVAKMDISTVRS